MNLLKKALKIRLFEQRLLKLYEQGHIFGTVHTCIGQEMVGLAAAEMFQQGDKFCSNHRGHGHYLALTDDQEGLLAEILARDSGVCRGMGGSQHLFHPKGFYSNGVQGGMAPIACGLALQAKMTSTGNLVTLFVGDGTLGEGTFYESLNLASKWELPLLVVVENNGIAQTTPIEVALAGSISGRARAFDIEYMQGHSNDWEGLRSQFAEASDSVRTKCRPLLIEVQTNRLKSHSKGDDTRDSEFVEELWSSDPVQKWLNTDDSTSELLESLEQELDSLCADILSRSQAQMPEARDDLKPKPASLAEVPESTGKMRCVDAIYGGLKALMTEDTSVVLLGEDIQSPYGGAFKVTQDLSEVFPERVLSTPISEAAIVGLASGLALGGSRPIVEIMFGDFLGLAFDQLINHAAKFSFMYGGKVSVPLVVRAPMGGYRGYGPTHSQSLEKHLLGIPDLDVVAINSRIRLSAFYRNLQSTVCNPTLLVENKLVYSKFVDSPPPKGFEILLSEDAYPLVRLRPKNQASDVVIFCYGGMLDLAELALAELFETHDILAEVYCPTRLHPLDLESLEAVFDSGQALVTLEEGLGFCGLGAEVLASLAESNRLPSKVGRLAAKDFIPSGRQAEIDVLPSVDELVQAVLEVTRVTSL